MNRAFVFCPAYALGAETDRGQILAAVSRVIPEAELSTGISFQEPGGTGVWASPSSRLTDLSTGMQFPLCFAARGGYGCLDIVEGILHHSGPFWPRLVGYSDVTVLHAALWARGRRDGIYGFMPAVPHGQISIDSTRSLVNGESIRRDHLTCPAAQVLVPGKAEGPLFPACLRVLAGLAGTSLQPSLRGCVLGIEDIDERPYRVDRDLWQLHAAGMLDGVVGLVAGRFPCENPAGYAGPSVAQVIRVWALRLGVPCVFAVPFGHEPDPVSLPVGGSCRLDCAEFGTWSLNAWP